MELSIVILTWNSLGYLRRCLESIDRNLKRVDPEIVVVDNHSMDGTADWVASLHPGPILIRNRANLGVSRARNQGIRKSTGEFVLLLDVDTEMNDDSILLLLEYAKSNPRAGIVGPKLTHPDGTLQLTCRRGHNLLIPFLRRLDFFPGIRDCGPLRSYHMEDYDHRTPIAVDHVIGACQLIRRDVIQSVGLLDETMFYGWEDTDYCIRARRAGFEVHYFPSTSVVHFEQRLTRRKMFSRLMFENIKSMFRFFLKYPSGLWGNYRIPSADSLR